MIILKSIIKHSIIAYLTIGYCVAVYFYIFSVDPNSITTTTFEERSLQFIETILTWPAALTR